MSSETVKYPCIKCSKDVKHDAIECSMCAKWSHRVCASLRTIKSKYFSNDNINWYCNDRKTLFPFRNMSSV